MALLTKAGSWVHSPGFTNATESITGVGFRPKAVIFFSTQLSDSDGFRSSARLTYGFSTGPNDSYGVAADAYNNSSNANTSRRFSIYPIMLVRESIETAVAEVDSFDADGFTIQWVLNNSSSDTAYVIHYLALGGDDLSAAAIDWTAPTSTGLRSVTGVGFEPTAVMHLHAGGISSISTSNTAWNSSAALGIGAMDAEGNQWGAAGFSYDGTSSSDSQRNQESDSCLTAINSIQEIFLQAEYHSMDADGFTMDFTTVNTGTAHPVASLCLRTTEDYGIRAGYFDKSVAPAPVSQTVTVDDVEPQALLFTGVQEEGQAAPTDDWAMGIGVTDGTTEGAVTIFDPNGLTVTDTAGSSTRDKAYRKHDNQNDNVDAEADMTGFSGDTFTMNWTTNDAVATRILYLAFGAEPTIIPVVIDDAEPAVGTSQATASVAMEKTVSAQTATGASDATAQPPALEASLSATGTAQATGSAMMTLGTEFSAHVSAGTSQAEATSFSAFDLPATEIAIGESDAEAASIVMLMRVAAMAIGESFASGSASTGTRMEVFADPAIGVSGAEADSPNITTYMSNSMGEGVSEASATLFVAYNLPAPIPAIGTSDADATMDQAMDVAAQIATGESDADATSFIEVYIAAQVASGDSAATSGAPTIAQIVSAVGEGESEGESTSLIEYYLSAESEGSAVGSGMLIEMGWVSAIGSGQATTSAQSPSMVMDVSATAVADDSAATATASMEQQVAAIGLGEADGEGTLRELVWFAAMVSGTSTASSTVTMGKRLSAVASAYADAMSGTPILLIIMPSAGPAIGSSEAYASGDFQVFGPATGDRIAFGHDDGAPFTYQPAIWLSDFHAHKREIIPLAEPTAGEVAFDHNLRHKRSLRVELWEPRSLRPRHDWIKAELNVWDRNGNHRIIELGHFLVRPGSITLNPSGESGSISGVDITWLMDQSTTQSEITLAPGSYPMEKARNYAREFGVLDSRILFPDEDIVVTTEQRWPPGTTYLHLINDLLSLAGCMPCWTTARGELITNRWEEGALITGACGLHYGTHSGLRIIPPINEITDDSMVKNRVVVRRVRTDEPTIVAVEQVTDESSPIHPERLMEQQGGTMPIYLDEVIEDHNIEALWQAKAMARARLQEFATFSQSLEVSHLICGNQEGNRLVTIDARVGDREVYSGKWWRESWRVPLQAGNGIMVSKMNRMVNVR